LAVPLACGEAPSAARAPTDGSMDHTTTSPTAALSAASTWNLLVIVPDTFRGDRLSANGYRRHTTPRLDALAADGANFRNTATVAPRTWQSFSSILTGRYPPRHGVRFIFDEPIPKHVPVIGSYLGQFGYETAAFDYIPFLEGMTGGDDFDEYIVDGTTAKLEKFATTPRERPFLGFIRLRGGHWPYEDRSFMPAEQACEEHDHSFNRGTYGVESAGDHKGFKIKDEAAFRRLIWTPDPDERSKQHRIAHYDSEIHHTDQLIGQLLDALEAKGILERTIIAVTSDHGESFGDHDYLQHGPRVDESVMHVPLIIHLPKSHPAYRPGIVIDSQVRVIDLFPTLVDALGLPLPPDTDGLSLLPLLRGGAAPTLWAYGEAGRSYMGIDPERHLEGVEGKHRMVRTDRFKLVYLPNRDEGEIRLYDLLEDPGELVNVAHQHPDVVKGLFENLESVRASGIEEGTESDLTEEQLERLRALGYVQ
jgi:arylsulfatase A-like enzyme